MNQEMLTDANRLAYTIPHEAQESSSSGTRAKGWSCSDEENDSRGANQTSAPSSQCALGQGERKERVTRLRRPYMTRNSFQKGYAFTRVAERGEPYTLSAIGCVLQMASGGTRLRP